MGQMKLLLQEEGEHVLMVRELLDNLPEFGIGDKVYVNENGVTAIFIDRIVEENGVMLYECHTDNEMPVRCYYTKDEVFSWKQFSKCKKAWEELQKQYETIEPNRIGLEKVFAYRCIIPKRTYGKRIDSVVFALLNNGYIYKKGFNMEPIYEKAKIEEDPYELLSNYDEEFKLWLKEHKGVCFEDSKPALETLYRLENGKFVSWNDVKIYDYSLRAKRIAVNKAM